MLLENRKERYIGELATVEGQAEVGSRRKIPFIEVTVGRLGKLRKEGRGPGLSAS